jgi:hypothetical protein
VTKTLAIVLLTAFSTAGCQKQTRYRVTLITDQPWTVGEARTCSFVDEKRDVMRCATPSKGSSETLMSREYLVDADFNKKPPVPQEPGGWYGIFCRLDSFERATCQVN